jgi:hypothetical protein
MRRRDFTAGLLLARAAPTVRAQEPTQQHLLWADDVPTCPVEIRAGGEIWVKPVFGYADPVRHWRQRLEDGLGHNLSLVIAKAVEGQLQRLLNRRAMVETVDLIEVDIIHAEPSAGSHRELCFCCANGSLSAQLSWLPRPRCLVEGPSPPCAASRHRGWRQRLQ